MTTTINGRTPEEIKKGLECCSVVACGSCPYEYYCNLENGYVKISNDALAYIQQLENNIGELTEKVSQFETAHPKWISVEDRLPEKDGKYIVCTAKGSVYCTRFKAYGKNGSFQTDINTHITHWMSLPSMPEPPKEDA